MTRTGTGRRILLAFLAALVLTSCRPDNPAGGGSPVSGGQEDARLRVVVEKPEPVHGVRSFVLPGSAEPWEVVPLYARVTGYLDVLHVDIGDPVDADEELARILVPEMEAELRAAEARIEREKAELALARLTHARLAKLHARNPEAVPRQQVDEAEARVDVEKAQLALARAELERLRALGSYSRLRAPFAGRITRRFADPGDLVREGTANGARPVVEIARTDKLRVVFHVPEPLVPHVSPGARVRVRFDALPGHELEATVSRTAGALDSDTRTLRAEIDLENPRGAYRPGMYASVELELEIASGALGVPARAVRGPTRKPYVWAVRDGVLEKVPVVVAWDDGRLAWVVRGLLPEDRVVVAAPALAEPGMAVEAVEEGS